MSHGFGKLYLRTCKNAKCLKCFIIQKKDKSAPAEKL